MFDVVRVYILRATQKCFFNLVNKFTRRDVENFRHSKFESEKIRWHYVAIILNITSITTQKRHCDGKKTTEGIYHIQNAIGPYECLTLRISTFAETSHQCLQSALIRRRVEMEVKNVTLFWIINLNNREISVIPRYCRSLDEVTGAITRRVLFPKPEVEESTRLLSLVY